MIKNKHIVIVGAGGMGALFGAILSESGLEVSLLDTDSEHVQKIQNDGLFIEGYGGDRTVKLPAYQTVSGISKADLIFFQCKSTQTQEAAKLCVPLMQKSSICISFQNGLGNEELIGRELGEDRVLGGLTAMAGFKIGPGHIRDFSRAPSFVGELGGTITDRVEQITNILTKAGLSCTPSTNIRKEIWKKLVGNIAMSAMSGVTNLTSTQILEKSELKIICLRALQEALTVSHGCGFDIQKEEAFASLESITTPGETGENKSSLCEDLNAGRKTEIEFIYGSVIRKADHLSIQVPTIKILYALIKGKEVSIK